MQQKTLIALGALVAVAILAFVTLRAPEKGEKQGPRPRPIAAFKAADVKELEVTSAGKDKVAMKLQDGSWVIAGPAAQTAKADQQAVRTAVDQLEKISFADLVTEKKEKFADLELSEDKGAHVVAKDGAGKVLFDAWIGKSGSGFTMIRPAGKDEAWQATGLYKYTYAKDSKGWRDHTVLELQKDDVSKLAVEYGGQKLVLDKVAPAAPAEGESKEAPKPPQETRWKVAESSVKVDPLDDSVANNMIGAMTSLRASDFADEAKPAEVGLAPPRYRLTATVKGQPVTLLIGNVKGDDAWIAVEGKPQVFLLRKYQLDRLAQKPIDFRDKQLVKAKEEDLTAVDLTVGGESYSLERDKDNWKLGKGPKTDLDPAKVKPVVSAFEDIKGAAFAETTDPKATGLAKPEGSATLHLRDRSTVTLKIGGKAPDSDDIFVQKAGSPDVLLVKKFAVDRFQKKLADLAKK